MSPDIYYPDQYVYKDVTYVKNYDGDTIDFKVRKTFDIGFGSTVTGETAIRIRLRGVDTFEIRDKDPEKKEKAIKGRDLVQEVLSSSDGRIILETFKDKTGKYGRYIADVYIRPCGITENRERWQSLAKILEDQGLLTGRTFR